MEPDCEGSLEEIARKEKEWDSSVSSGAAGVGVKTEHFIKSKENGKQPLSPVGKTGPALGSFLKGIFLQGLGGGATLSSASSRD